MRVDSEFIMLLLEIRVMVFFDRYGSLSKLRQRSRKTRSKSKEWVLYYSSIRLQKLPS